MTIDRDDALPVWTLVKNTDLPRHQLVPLLRDLGLPVEMDETGEVISSKAEFRQLLVDVAAAENEAVR